MRCACRSIKETLQRRFVGRVGTARASANLFVGIGHGISPEGRTKPGGGLEVNNSERRETGPQVFGNSILVLMIGRGVRILNAIVGQISLKCSRGEGWVVIHHETVRNKIRHELSTPVCEGGADSRRGTISEGEHPGTVGVRINQSQSTSDTITVGSRRDFNIHVHKVKRSGPFRDGLLAICRAPAFAEGAVRASTFKGWVAKSCHGTRRCTAKATMMLIGRDDIAERVRRRRGGWGRRGHRSRRSGRWCRSGIEEDSEGVAMVERDGDRDVTNAA